MLPLITAVAGVFSALSSVSTLESTPIPAAPDVADPSAASAQGTSFADALNTAINRLDGAIATANAKAKAFASGDPDVSLSDVMVSLEQANVALQAAATVRDKIITAYTNVMNMPV